MQNVLFKLLKLVEYAKSIDAEYIAHGSTGAGNDQVRFDMIFQTLAPGIKIITPIRDRKLTRQQEIDYLKEKVLICLGKKQSILLIKGFGEQVLEVLETLESEKPLPSEAYPSQLETCEGKKK